MPLPPGSRVLVGSSGAAVNGSPLSGGYTGAKRMLWLLAKYANGVSQQKGLGIRFQAIVPQMMVGGTGVGDSGANAYARSMGAVIDGEDVVQDTFVRAYQALPELDAATPLRPWLFRIAHNRALDLLRGRAVRMAEPMEAAMDIADPEQPDPEELLMRQQAVPTPSPANSCGSSGATAGSVSFATTGMCSMSPPKWTWCWRRTPRVWATALRADSARTDSRDFAFLPDGACGHSLVIYMQVNACI